MKWTNKEIKRFIQEYPVNSIDMLSKKYNRSINSIYSKASQLKLSHREFNSLYPSKKLRKYFFDEKYFDKINTNEKAYFLGLLYADGYNKTTTGYIELGLSTKDIHILKEFNVAVKSNRPIRRYIDNRPGRSHDGSRLFLQSRHMSNQLEKLGCGRKKTFKIRFPTWLRKDFVCSFIRGYFDGDGSFFISKTKVKSSKKTYVGLIAGVGITSNSEFTEQLHEILVEKFGKTGIYFVKDKRINNVSSIHIRGKAVIKFMNWIYSISGPRLKRKEDKYRIFQKGKVAGLRGKKLADFCEKI